MIASANTAKMQNIFLAGVASRFRGAGVYGKISARHDAAKINTLPAEGIYGVPSPNQPGAWQKTGGGRLRPRSSAAVGC